MTSKRAGNGGSGTQERRRGNARRTTLDEISKDVLLGQDLVEESYYATHTLNSQQDYFSRLYSRLVDPLEPSFTAPSHLGPLSMPAWRVRSVRIDS